MPRSKIYRRTAANPKNHRQADQIAFVDDWVDENLRARKEDEEETRLLTNDLYPIFFKYARNRVGYLEGPIDSPYCPDELKNITKEKFERALGSLLPVRGMDPHSYGGRGYKAKFKKPDRQQKDKDGPAENSQTTN